MDSLDDGLVLRVLRCLPAPSVCAVAAVSSRLRALAADQGLWRDCFARDHPAQFERAIGAPVGSWTAPGGVAACTRSRVHPTLDWRLTYRKRVHADASWHGSLPWPQHDVLRSHAGPVFGAAFLEPPFPPGLAISAGVYGEQEEAEVTLWEVGRGRYPTVGRLGWQLQAAQALRGLAGVFDCRQREGTTQVVLCGFSGQAMVATICPLPVHVHQTAAQRGDTGSSSSGSPPALAVAAAVEAAVKAAQLGARQGADSPCAGGEPSESTSAVSSLQGHRHDSSGRSSPVSSGSSDVGTGVGWHARVTKHLPAGARPGRTGALADRQRSPPARVGAPAKETGAGASRQGAAGGGQAETGEYADMQAKMLRERTNLRLCEDGWSSDLRAPEQLGAGYSLTVDHVLAGHQGACVSAATRHDLIATAAFDGTIRLWRTPDGQPGSSSVEPAGQPPSTLAPVATLADPAIEDPVPPPVCGLALAHDGRTAGGAGNDRQVKLWDVERQAVVTRMDGHLGWVWNMLPLSDDLSVLATGATDSCVCCWDTRAGERVGTAAVACIQPDNVYPIGGLTAREDGLYLVAGCFDGGVYVIDRRQMKVLHRLAGHTDRVTRVSCQGDAILSGSFDSTCCLWQCAP